MALAMEDKRAIVEEVNKIAVKAYSVIAADYSGISVEKLTVLRNKARESGVYLRVVRNTLARKAVENTHFECIKDKLVGQLILAFSSDDPGSAARIVNDFTKENKEMAVKIVAISGRLLTPDDIERISKIPTYSQAISMLMSVMKAPIEKFVRTLNEPHGKLVRTIAAIKDQKEQAK